MITTRPRAADIPGSGFRQRLRARRDPGPTLSLLIGLEGYVSRRRSHVLSANGHMAKRTRHGDHRVRLEAMSTFPDSLLRSRR